MGTNGRRRWVCEFCGASGVLALGEDIDQTQCDMCGEPVVPVG
jgi:hypothetical protein